MAEEGDKNKKPLTFAGRYFAPNTAQQQAY